MTPTRAFGPRAPRAAALWLAVLGVSASAARAVAFYPEVSGEGRYTDNVRFTAGAGGEAASDWATRLRLELPLEQALRNGMLRVRYDVGYERHRDFPQLDHDEHELRLDLDAALRHGGGLNLLLRGARTQNQVRADSQASPDLFLAPRTNRDIVRGDLAYEAPPAGAWRWSGRLSAGAFAYQPIEGFDAATPGDRREYGLRFDAARGHPSRSFALHYGYRRFEIEGGGRENVHAIGAGWTRDARGLTWGLEAAAFLRELAPVGPTGIPEPRRSEADVLLAARLSREYRWWLLRLEAYRGPSSGGTLTGTSTDSVVGLSLGRRGATAWRWSLHGRAAWSDPTDPTDPRLRTVTVATAFELRPLRRLGLRWSAHVADQSSRREPSLDGSFAAAGFGVVFAPIGAAPESAPGRQ